MILGWHGSVHNYLVISTTEYMLAAERGQRHLCFTENQYILGDTASGPSERVNLTYKSTETEFPNTLSTITCIVH